VMNSQARRLLGRPATNEITNNQFIWYNVLKQRLGRE
jgi:hypothetical protein